MLDDHRRLLREAFAAHGGREIDTQGDSFFDAFRTAEDAIAAAVEGQRALAAHDGRRAWSCGCGWGLHTGEPRSATRGMSASASTARPGSGRPLTAARCWSRTTTRALVEDDLPEGVFLRDLGPVRLKDIDRPERISQLAAEGLQAEFPPLRGASR